MNKVNLLRLTASNSFDDKEAKPIPLSPQPCDRSGRFENPRFFLEEIEAHIAAAVKKGAKVVTGRKRAAEGGSFFEPTVLTDVTTDMVITNEETFGPVAPLYRFKTDVEAIKMANDTEFSLAAYFYSRDIGRIWRVEDALEYRIEEFLEV
jgi:hypothetical protein